MRYLIDTDVFSAMVRRHDPGLREHLARLGADEVAVSVVTLGEVEFGLHRRQVGAALAGRARALREVLRVLPIDERTVPHYAHTRHALEKAGTPIGPNDTWLAAHALAEDLTLVTGNEREFRRVPGLRVENWLR